MQLLVDTALYSPAAQAVQLVAPELPSVSVTRPAEQTLQEVDELASLS
jgi:hypothetical protein